MREELQARRGRVQIRPSREKCLDHGDVTGGAVIAPKEMAHGEFPHLFHQRILISVKAMLDASTARRLTRRCLPSWDGAFWGWWRRVAGGGWPLDSAGSPIPLVLIVGAGGGDVGSRLIDEDG